MADIEAQRCHAREHAAGAPRPLNRLAEDVSQEQIAFLLIPGFSYLSFASAIEPLRMANMVAGRPGYAAVTVSVDGNVVEASNGVCTMPDYAMDELPRVQAVFVCGANPIRYPCDRKLRRWLQRLGSERVLLGGIDTGSDLLARSGLLNGYRCTIHWQDMQSLVERYPEVVVSSQVFEIDRDRFTCSGGTASMDMMLQFIGRRPDGPEVASAVADLLVHERIRGSHDRQRIPLWQRLGSVQSKLSSAVMLMEANIEEPLRLPEIAEHVGISTRHLERLFHEHIDCTPIEYYMELRLFRAREKLMYTDVPVAEIASQCGFRTAPHLTRRYRRYFGISPTQDRRSARVEADAS